jgi:hypothetical protein
MMSASPARRAFAGGLVVAAVMAMSATALAGGKPEDVFAGKVLVSTKRFPATAKSPREFIAKLKKQKTDRIWEDKAKQEWKVHYAAFFKRPIDDLEVTIKLWDVTGGARHMLSSFEVYMNERGERVLLSNVVIERKYFGVNKRILMTIEDHRGRVLASGQFTILGEGERYSGKVSFTEDETKGPDGDDEEKKQE